MMRDPKRIWPLCSALYALWMRFPDWRLGQLIENLTGCSDNFYVEDDDLMRMIQAVYDGTHDTVKLP